MYWDYYLMDHNGISNMEECPVLPLQDFTFLHAYGLYKFEYYIDDEGNPTRKHDQIRVCCERLQSHTEIHEKLKMDLICQTDRVYKFYLSDLRKGGGVMEMQGIPMLPAPYTKFLCHEGMYQVKFYLDAAGNKTKVTRHIKTVWCELIRSNEQIAWAKTLKLAKSRGKSVLDIK